MLSLVAEGSTHGFAVARVMAPGGEVGRVWAMRRPLVYRTFEVLAGRGLTQTAGKAPSTAGPQRTLIEVTPEGERRVQRWLSEPVQHVRDARADLMLKLLFLGRRGVDPGPLLDLQRERFLAHERELRTALGDAEGFARTLTLSRRTARVSEHERGSTRPPGSCVNVIVSRQTSQGRSSTTTRPAGAARRRSRAADLARSVLCRSEHDHQQPHRKHARPDRDRSASQPRVNFCSRHSVSTLTPSARAASPSERSCMGGEDAT